MNEHFRILKEGFARMWREYRLLHPSGERRLYGWYSHQAAKRHDRVEYSRPDGSTVICTVVINSDFSNRYNPGEYTWPDAQWVGEVTKYIRTLPPLLPQFLESQVEWKRNA